MKKVYSVEEVLSMATSTLIPTFAATDEGQAQLNRIAKAITNESIDKRIVSQRQTHAKAAFDKALAKVATTTPDKVTAFVTGKEAWITSYITRKYSTFEE
jgi:hypothetical protein